MSGVFRVAFTILAGAVFAGAQTDAHSQLLSDRVSSVLPVWVKLSGEERVRFEAHNAFAYKPADDAFILNRIRVQADLQPLGWLGISLQMQDSRVFLSATQPPASNQQDPLEFRRFYVQLGNLETSPIAIRVGRQPLAYGETRLISEGNWGNVGRSFDATRVILRHAKSRLEFVAAALDKADPNGFDKPTPGDRFFGAYATLEQLVPASSFEPYLFWKMANNIATELAGPGKQRTWTAGLRWAGKLPDSFDYSIEMARQHGHIGGQPTRAWAGHWLGGYTFEGRGRKPRVYAEFNYASGDRDPHDGKRGTFEVIAAGAHDKFGVLDRVLWSNVVQVRSGLQHKILPTLTLGLAYNSIWVAQIRDGIYLNGKMAVKAVSPQSRHIGNEPDIQAQWNASPAITVMANYGRILPGGYLRSAGFHAINGFSLGFTRLL